MSDSPKPTETDSQAGTLHGSAPTWSDEGELAAIIEKAFDYRGDVTLETRDGETLEGYIFDRRSDDHVPHLRIMLKDGGRQCVNYASIAKLAFSGRDTAEGKAWETWVRKYVEQKRRGEKAGIASESLEE